MNKKEELFTPQQHNSLKNVYSGSRLCLYSGVDGPSVDEIINGYWLCQYSGVDSLSADEIINGS